MHKSKLAGFIIDCQTDDLKSAGDFWSAALGMRQREFPGEEGKKYMELLDSNDELHVEVQIVAHESRVHLDIETDDVAAEVKRLEALGAISLGWVENWCVMQAPTGQKFCVVLAESPIFSNKANQW